MKVTRQQWRWVVLVATVISSLFFEGLLAATGVYLVVWKGYFDCTAAEISFIASTQVMMFHVGGLSSGALINRFGYRVMATLGGLMSSLGVLLSVFAPSRLMLCLTYGVVSGFFAGALFPANAVALANYFDKNFSTIRGISSGGSGIGIILFPPLVQFLTDVYGWQGSLLIVSAIMGNLVVGGLLLRPVDSWGKRPVENQGEVPQPEHRRRDKGGPNGAVYQRVSGSNDIADDTTHEFNRCQPMDNEGNAYVGARSLSSNCEGVAGNGESLTVDGKSTDETITDGMETSFMDVEIIRPSNSEAQSARYAQMETCPKGDGHSCEITATNEVATASLAMECRDVANAISIMTRVKSNNPLRAVFHAVGLSMLSYSFRLPVLMFSQFIIAICYNAVISHLPNMVVLRGIKPQMASFLMSFLGIGSTIGRVGGGVLPDLSRLSPSNVYMIFMVICGVTVIVCMASSTYWLYALSCTLAGVSSGGTFSLQVVLAWNYVGKDHLGKAVGLVLLSHGLGGIVGPVLGGWLYDLTGTYHLTFYVFGATLSLSGFVFLLEPILRRLEAKKARRILKEHGYDDEASVENVND
ncbi:monocarboxylate transporter 14-like [Diadema antillarum]|uniref:monocarboxylate transporter 14-like n=1 Tax=Diadema antillarum TaxID=105358 RepID=UPI003A8C50F2